MSLLSWLFPKAPPAAARPPAASADKAQPSARPGPPAGAGGAVRSDERMQRREQLYAVVRDVMVRAGVLSAGYKFKVLSLDPRGAQFLVMVDMAPEYAGEPMLGIDTEALIVQTAKARCDIAVTAVYWRVNTQLGAQLPLRSAATAAAGASSASPIVAPTRPAEAAHPAPTAMPPRAAALGEVTSRPAPLVPPARASARFEPIEADEVAAFKQALASAAAARPAAPVAADLGVATRSGPLLPPSTGFEDTLVPGQDSRKADLSATQYGDL